MLQHEENCDPVYTVILENHLKYICLNINNANANANKNMVLVYFTMLYQLLCLCNISKMR
jgi:hypothetical protein